MGISEFVLSARTRHKKVGRVGLYQTNKMASQRHQEKMGGQCKIGSLQRNVSVRGSFVKISVTYLDTNHLNVSHLVVYKGGDGDDHCGDGGDGEI